MTIPWIEIAAGAGLVIGGYVLNWIERSAPGWLYNYRCWKYRRRLAREVPVYCAADRDGDCSHPNCCSVPGKGCPLPDYPEDD